MRTLFLVLLLGVFTLPAQAQLYINITQPPYSANSTCTSGTDDGKIINQAITDILNQSTNSYASGSVIYFPPGCYLIATEILDPGVLSNGNGSGIGIAYLGFGRVELQAASTLKGGIIKFGDDTPHTATRRHLENLYFECANVANLDGIQIDGLINSEFDDIEVRDCTNNGIETVGTNGNTYSNIINGGGVVTYTNAANGIALGYGANQWVINGTKVSSEATASTGFGIDFEGWGNSCIGCAVQNWRIGIAQGDSSSGSSLAHGGLEISGGYYESNSVSHIRIGYAGQATSNGAGISIHGAYFNGVNDATGTARTPVCIDLQWAAAFSIVGNQFTNCLDYNVRALADASMQGADNGVVGPNDSNGSATYQLLGNNITFNGPACISGSSPAACGYVSSGQVAIPAGSFSLVVDDPFVSANSRILINEDMTIGSHFSPAVTCNTTGGRTYSVTSKTPGTSFTITASSAPSGHPACLVFSVQN